jgi:hypothetical protein
MDELLNVERVRELRRNQGRKIAWLIEQLGMSRSAGYLMFRKGLLPEDRTRRKVILEQLATTLGTEVPQILLSPPGPARKSA